MSEEARGVAPSRSSSETARLASSPARSPSSSASFLRLSSSFSASPLPSLSAGPRLRNAYAFSWSPFSRALIASLVPSLSLSASIAACLAREAAASFCSTCCSFSRTSQTDPACSWPSMAKKGTADESADGSESGTEDDPVVKESLFKADTLSRHPDEVFQWRFEEENSQHIGETLLHLAQMEVDLSPKRLRGGSTLRISLRTRDDQGRYVGDYQVALVYIVETSTAEDKTLLGRSHWLAERVDIDDPLPVASFACSKNNMAGWRQCVVRDIRDRNTFPTNANALRFCIWYFRPREIWNEPLHVSKETGPKAFSLGETLQERAENGQARQVWLQGKEDGMHCHQEVLRACLPLVEEVEEETEEVTRVDMGETLDKSGLEALLHFCFHGRLPEWVQSPSVRMEVKERTVTSLLEVGQRFKFHQLVNACDWALASFARNAPLSSLPRQYIFARQHDAEVTARCLRRALARNLNELNKVQGYHELRQAGLHAEVLEDHLNLP